MSVLNFTTEPGAIIRNNVRVGYSTTTQKQTQTVTATSTQLDTIEVALARYGTALPPLTLRVEEGATLLAEVVIQPANLSTNFRLPTWVSVPLPATVLTVAGTQYRVSLSTPTVKTTAFYYWPIDTADPYTFGELLTGTTNHRIDALVRGIGESGPPPPPPPPPPPSEHEGFGAITQGGTGQPVYHVTTLADSGPGSLRDAISVSNRYIVFDVAGTITPTSDYLWLKAFQTIDGLSAPEPGITIMGRGMLARGTRGSHDVIVTGLRFRVSTIDGFSIDSGAYNVVLAFCSMHGAGDGCMDIGQSNTHDITVAWNFIYNARGEGKTSLVAYRPQRITLHHNLYMGPQRSPQVRYDDTGAISPEITVDFVNNFVRQTSGNYGSLFKWGVKANVVDNYFIPWPGDEEDVLNYEGPGTSVYEHGNTHPGQIFNQVALMAAPFAAPPVTTTDALTAAHRILDVAGPKYRDDIDATMVTQMRSILPPL